MTREGAARRITLSSASLIHFPRISDTKATKRRPGRRENTQLFGAAHFGFFLIKKTFSLSPRRGVLVCSAQPHGSRRFFSYPPPRRATVGTRKYDNLVRLACFIRRYFSNATFPVCGAPVCSPVPDHSHVRAPRKVSADDDYSAPSGNRAPQRRTLHFL